VDFKGSEAKHGPLTSSLTDHRFILKPIIRSFSR